MTASFYIFSKKSYWQRLSLMQTLPLIPREERSIPISFFFDDLIFAAPFRFESLIITFLKSLLVFIHWQSLIFAGFTFTSNFSYTFNAAHARSFWNTGHFKVFSPRVLAVTPALSFHFYYPLLSNIPLKCLLTTSSDSNFSNSFFN